MSTSSEPQDQMLIDPIRLQEDFPILQRPVKGKRLVFLDSAASAQKPRAVIEAMSRFQEEGYANIHRGVYELSAMATKAFEDAREKVRRFVNAAETAEIIFTRGTTESINLVAQSFGRSEIGEGDEILLTEMEHHSNIVPWQLLAAEKGAHLRYIRMSDQSELDLSNLDDLINERTKIVAVGHVSNALGNLQPVRTIIAAAKRLGVPVLLDGAQAVPHLPVDVRELNCDFYAFSAHKLYGPTGIGVLYGRRELLEKMPPWQGGGDMIRTVTLEKTSYNDLPWKFEAGTPAITEVIGLGAAIDYLENIGMASIHAYGRELMSYATEVLACQPGLRILADEADRVGALSFLMVAAHPHDIATILDAEGVAVRAGHHCAQPIMDHLGISGTTRASFTFYNSREDVDALASALGKVWEMFGS
jgi:cysteine desulfurase / selenocysteine lyase